MRVRRELVRRGLDRVLFDAVTRQLEAKGVTVRTGTLVDATHASNRWAIRRRRKPVHGHTAHVATGHPSGFSRSIAETSAGDSLLDAGKPRMLALIAVARKLLAILNAVLRDRRPWHTA